MEASTAVNHEDLVVIDGLVFFSDGDASPLKAGNVAAANVTVIEPLADLEAAVDGIASWHRKLSLPDSPWRLVRTAQDILDARAAGKVGLIMGWQNSDPIGNRIDRVRLFHALGLRVVQLTYNHANLVGDGCLETRNGGLTRFGAELVHEMNEVGMAVDLSHCSNGTCIDAARTSQKPVILTHANATGVARRARNKSDESLRAVADSGGVVGVSVHGFMNWSGDPSTPPSLSGFVEHIRYVANLVGYEHVGMGNDFASVSDPKTTEAILEMSASKFPGATGDFVAAFGNALEGRYPAEVPSPQYLSRITDALSEAGLSGAQIEGVMGQNFLRTFKDIWN